MNNVSSRRSFAIFSLDCMANYFFRYANDIFCGIAYVNLKLKKIEINLCVSWICNFNERVLELWKYHIKTNLFFNIFNPFWFTFWSVWFNCFKTSSSSFTEPISWRPLKKFKMKSWKKSCILLTNYSIW